tara:strand:+ start:1151 stop:2404 length:1254 start_codon:yes stop_codon:yes gene_type:complete
MNREELFANQKDNALCAYPFFSIRNGQSHGYAPCCWAMRQQLVGPHTDTVFDYFDGPEAVELRRGMLSGEITNHCKAVCYICHRREKESGTSPRLMMPLDHTMLDLYNDDGTYNHKHDEDHPPRINLELNFYGNYCNLECYGCHPADSTTREKRLEKLSELRVSEGRDDWFTRKQNDVSWLPTDLRKVGPEQFERLVEDIVDNADRVGAMGFCGGEPMLMKSHFQVLDALVLAGKAKHMKLNYVSNMTLWDMDKMEKYTKEFKFINLQWSCDGLGDRNHYLRYPTKWDETWANVQAMQEWCRETGKGVVQATYTPSLLSLFKIKEVFAFFEENGLKERPFTIYNRLENPRFLQVNNLPEPIKEQIFDDVNSVCESTAKDMMRPCKEGSWEIAKEYFDDLDRTRGTNWRQTFPEFDGY